MSASSSRTAGVVRILLVSASPFGRAYLRRTLDVPGRIEVAGVVAGPDEAMGWLPPDGTQVVVWDAEGNEAQALARAPELARRRRARVLVLVGASWAPASAAETATEAEGVVETLSKPAGPVAAGRAFAQALVARVEALALRRWEEPARLNERPPGADAKGEEGARPLPIEGTGRPARRVVAIGASTGGPRALETLVQGLPPGLPVAVLVTQHMPRGFTAPLARRLSDAGPIRFVEAYEAAPLEEGVGFVAPAGWHLTVGADGRLHLDDGPPVHHVRPAVDVMLWSVARRFGPDALAVILTGMGTDGVDGARAIRAAGGCCFAQDPASAVAPSMPGAVVREGLADCVAPLELLARAVAQWALGRSPCGQRGEG